MGTETYKLTCHSCHREVVLPAAAPDRAEMLACPNCKQVLRIEWRGGDA